MKKLYTLTTCLALALTPPSFAHADPLRAKGKARMAENFSNKTVQTIKKNGSTSTPESPGLTIRDTHGGTFYNYVEAETIIIESDQANIGVSVEGGSMNTTIENSVIIKGY